MPVLVQGPTRFILVSTDPASNLDKKAARGNGVIMAMGKGGGARTTIAAYIAIEFAKRGHAATLTTPDPAATPIHEAMQLERDLTRAEIRPFAWVVNQSLTPPAVTDPVPCSRGILEAKYRRGLSGHAHRIILMSWNAETNHGALS